MKASGNDPEVFFVYGCFCKFIKEESPCTAMPIRYLAARPVRVLRQSWPFARLVLQAGLQLRRECRLGLAGTGHPGTGSVPGASLQPAPAAASGQPIWQTKYETEKAALRRQIRSVLAKAASLEEFSAQLLQEHGVTVSESRGRFSYRTADRTKPISSRKLGDDFSKEKVLAVLTQNAERKKTSELYSSDPHPNRISRLIDIQAKLAAGKGAGYEHWAKIFNLKQLAKSMALFTRYNLNSEEELDARVKELAEKYGEAHKVVKDLEERIKANRELSRHALAYVQNKKFAQQVKTAKNPEAFREQHRAELTAYQAAAAYFKKWCMENLETPVSQKQFSQFLFKSAGKYNLTFSKHIGGEYRGYKGVCVRPDCARS